MRHLAAASTPEALGSNWNLFRLRAFVTPSSVIGIDFMVPVLGKLRLYDWHRTTSLTRRRALKLGNTRAWQGQVVARLASPPRYSDLGLKCDLHPRWDRSDEKVCIDTARSGSRQVEIYDLAGTRKQMAAGCL